MFVFIWKWPIGTAQNRRRLMLDALKILIQKSNKAMGLSSVEVEVEVHFQSMLSFYTS